MRLPPFELHRPATLEEATGLLERHGDDAALYCGGTELLLLMKLGFAEPGHLVDVKGIAELSGVRAGGGTLSIGAATTHRELERAPAVAERWPALAEMERTVANVRVRNAGTIGGNLCFSDPHSDPATFLLCADATLVCRRGGGEPRRVPASGFARGPYQTALEPGELLVAVEVPEPPAGAVIVHRKLCLHERPAVTVTCLARVDGGRVAEARVAVGSVGLVPVRAAAA
ncbi:MAG: xanthine dehydrogenase family protein subunit M, partial [Thermoleophilia bacterium]|nr:xanthine dehydrogenase family protein subunit M [Thermoleophilia bacterium]